jgi:hypothetical protein
VIISYRKLVKALEFYRSRGFGYIDVPWIVGDESYGVTKPANSRDFSTFAGNLVASGEQSFLDKMLAGKMPYGRSACITPCFRDELVQDQFHLQYFMKVELIYFGKEERLARELDTMIEHARQFFSQYLGLENIQRVETPEGVDLMSQGIELGSYGIRRYKNYAWVYGTGCAEQRLSQVIRASKINNLRWNLGVLDGKPIWRMNLENEIGAFVVQEDQGWRYEAWCLQTNNMIFSKTGNNLEECKEIVEGCIRGELCVI